MHAQHTHLLYAELGVVMVTVLVCVRLALLSNAPVKSWPIRHSRKASEGPWYFLSLQELMSFSTFIGSPGNHCTHQAQRFRSGPRAGEMWLQARQLVARGRRPGRSRGSVAIEACAFASAAARWFRIPQLVIVRVLERSWSCYSIYSIWLVNRHKSARLLPSDCLRVLYVGLSCSRSSALFPRTELGFLLVAIPMANALTCRGEG
jgi:hypothetical protein